MGVKKSMSKGKRWEQPTEAGTGGRAGRDVAVHSYSHSINVRSGPTLHCARDWNAEIL